MLLHEVVPNGIESVEFPAVLLGDQVALQFQVVVLLGLCLVKALPGVVQVLLQFLFAHGGLRFGGGCRSPIVPAAHRPWLGGAA